MRLDHIFYHIVKLAQPDYAVIKALDLAYELFYILLDFPQDRTN